MAGREVLRAEVPDLSSIQPTAVAIGLVAAYLLFRRDWSVLRTLAACATVGLLSGLVTTNLGQ